MSEKTDSFDRYIRLPEVVNISGLSPTTIWRLEMKRRFPSRRKISRSAVGWLASEVAEWLQDPEAYQQG